jgi:hypothetical protein
MIAVFRIVALKNEQDTDSQAIAILLHREVLEARGTSFTFQVELVRQWFARVR